MEKGSKHSKESRLKQSLAHKGKKLSEEHKAKLRQPHPHIREEKSANWKGDNAGYGALHAWVRRQLGTPSICAHCKINDSKKFEWANISGKYKRDLNDWIRLCVKCHHTMDNIVFKINQSKLRNKLWRTK